MKALPLASTEVSAALESYHTQLKLRLLNEEDSGIYQRADWLVDKLGTKVHSYYWLDEYSGKENFARYWKDEWKSGLSSWRMALQIPDSDVIIDGKRAKVVSSKDREVVHIVLNPGSEFAICSCSWSRMGNLCKHAIKSAKVYREKGLAMASTSLFEYNRILMNILHSPPNDSIIRDHAVAMAVSVQAQLTALFDLRSGATNSTVPREQQLDIAETGVASTNLDNPDEDLTGEQQPVSENNADNLVNENHSITENNDESGDTAWGNVAQDTPGVDRNNMATHARACNVFENGQCDGCTSSRQVAVQDNSGNKNVHLQCSLDCNGTVMDSNDANEKVGINHRMDVTLDKDEASSDNFMKKRDRSPVSSAAAFVNDASGKALEDATDPMDVEMPSVPVEGHIVGDSSGMPKESMDISPDVPSVINGVA